MKKIIKLTGGILVGTTMGVAAALLLAPKHARKLQARLTSQLTTLQEEARRAAEERRRALEAEIARLRGELPGNDL